MTADWKHYATGGAYDELLSAYGRARPGAGKVLQYLRALDDMEIQERREAADLAMQLMGITFTVYQEEGGIDRVWPFDIIPRMIPADQ